MRALIVRKRKTVPGGTKGSSNYRGRVRFGERFKGGDQALGHYNPEGRKRRSSEDQEEMQGRVLVLLGRGAEGSEGGGSSLDSAKK